MTIEVKMPIIGRYSDPCARLPGVRGTRNKMTQVKTDTIAWERKYRILGRVNSRTKRSP